MSHWPSSVIVINIVSGWFFGSGWPENECAVSAYKNKSSSCKYFKADFFKRHQIKPAQSFMPCQTERDRSSNVKHWEEWSYSQEHIWPTSYIYIYNAKNMFKNIFVWKMSKALHLELPSGLMRGKLEIIWYCMGHIPCCIPGTGPLISCFRLYNFKIP